MRADEESAFTRKTNGSCRNGSERGSGKNFHKQTESSSQKSQNTPTTPKLKGRSLQQLPSPKSTSIRRNCCKSSEVLSSPTSPTKTTSRTTTTKSSISSNNSSRKFPSSQQVPINQDHLNQSRSTSSSSPKRQCGKTNVLRRQCALESSNSSLDEKLPKLNYVVKIPREIVIPKMNLMSTSSAAPLRKNKVASESPAQIPFTTTTSTADLESSSLFSKLNLHGRTDPDGGCDYNYNNICITTTTNGNANNRLFQFQETVKTANAINYNHSNGNANKVEVVAPALQTTQKNSIKPITIANLKSSRDNVTMTEKLKMSKLRLTHNTNQQINNGDSKRNTSSSNSGHGGARKISKPSCISTPNQKNSVTTKRQTVSKDIPEHKTINSKTTTTSSRSNKIKSDNPFINVVDNKVCKEKNISANKEKICNVVQQTKQFANKVNGGLVANRIKIFSKDKDSKSPSPDKMGSVHGNCCESKSNRMQLDKDDVELQPTVNYNSNGNDDDNELEFLMALEPRLEILEGTDLELQVKIKGARKVVWVKDDKIIPNVPPDFEYKSNPVDGTYGLKVREAFVEDSGVYICEVYGNHEESDAICWCRVNVIEEVEETDNTSIETLGENEIDQQPKRELIVPLIITSDANETEEFLKMELEANVNTNSPIPPPISSQSILDEKATDKRLLYSTTSSAHSSKDIYEDALDEVTIVKNPDCSDSKESQNLEVCPQENALGEISITNSRIPKNPEILDQCPQKSPEKTDKVFERVETDDPVKEGDDSKIQFTTEIGLNSTIKSSTIQEASQSTSSLLLLNESKDEENEGKKDYSKNITCGSDTSFRSDTFPSSVSISPSSSTEIDHDIASSPTVLENFIDVESQPPQIPNGIAVLDEILDAKSKTETPKLKTQLSTESVESSQEVRSSGSSVDCGSAGYLGRFRDSLTDNPLAPRFIMGPANFIALLGETVNLRVKISTTEEQENTVVTWCKLVRGVFQNIENSPGNPTTDRIQISKPTNDLITLQINKANYEDSGKYRVKVENPHGCDYHHCLLSVEGPPEPPPTAPTAHFDEQTNSILVSWACCPFDGGSALSGYRLEMKYSNDDWNVLSNSDFKGLCFWVKNPTSNTSCSFRVSAENSHGLGNYSLTSDKFYIPKPSDDSDSFSLSRCSSSSTNTHGSFDSSESPYDYADVELKQEDVLTYYDKFEQLGKGRFGVVFKITNKHSQKSYAGKFVKCRKAADKARTQLEYKIMNDLKYHPKLICLVDAYELPREIVIVTEMIVGGELFEKVVADDFTLTERDCVAFLRQICNGVKYIHEKNIMHLDLKPENILCTQKTSNQIKIIDFGLAQYYNPDDPIKVLFGTAEFVSPEIINYETICPATDMWAVGVITYILLSGLSPFLGDDDNETFSNITRGDYDFDDEAFDKVSEDAKDFISCLMVKRKEKRLTADECLRHKWLALSDAEKKHTILPTDKLKRFLLRRKWQKTGNAIRALGRITTLYSSSRRSSSGASNPSVSSPAGPFGLNRSLSKQDSTECDSVFTSLDETNGNKTPVEKSSVLSFSSSSSTNPCIINDNNYLKSKYDGSDSGVCDVVHSTNNNNSKSH